MELRVAAVTSDVPTPGFDESEFLALWDPEIRRRSIRSARHSGLGECEADDLAQEVSLALLLAVREKRGPLSENYVRRLTTNVLRSEWRKRNRLDARQVPIEQARLGDIRPQARRKDTRPPDELDPEELDPWRRRDAHRRLEKMPPRLESTFDSIYRQGCSQREAARLIEISQQRVAQLHGKLLRWGRKELAGIAA